MKPSERQEVFETLKAKYEGEGYVTKEHTISVLTANLMAFVIALPIVIICGVIYFNVYHPFDKNNTAVIYISSVELILGLILMIAFIFIHELLHGMTWKRFCKDKKSISYWLMWKQATPYCCCVEPLTFKGYILGGLMPFIVIGIGLFIVALVLENTMIFILSMFNIIGASGDLTIALMLLKCRKSVIIDHPTKCGFVTFNK